MGNVGSILYVTRVQEINSPERLRLLQESLEEDGRLFFWINDTAVTWWLVTCQLEGPLDQDVPSDLVQYTHANSDVMSAEASGTFLFLFLTFWANTSLNRKTNLKPRGGDRWWGQFSFRPPRYIMWTTLLCSQAPPLHGGVCWDVSSLPRAVSLLSRKGGWEEQKNPPFVPLRAPWVTAGSSQMSPKRCIVGLLTADVQLLHRSCSRESSGST